jgi:hypothetical protein
MARAIEFSDRQTMADSLCICRPCQAADQHTRSKECHYNLFHGITVYLVDSHHSQKRRPCTLKIYAKFGPDSLLIIFYR